MRYGAQLGPGGAGRMPTAARGLCPDAGRLSAVGEQSTPSRNRGPLLLPFALSFSFLVIYCIIIYLLAFIRCMLAAALPGLSAHGVCVRVFVLHSAAYPRLPEPFQAPHFARCSHGLGMRLTSRWERRRQAVHRRAAPPPALWMHTYRYVCICNRFSDALFLSDRTEQAPL